MDLNADLGEVLDGVPTHDAGLVEVVTSANVACGFHSGDTSTMRRVSGLCVERGVTIGAQVSYRDREGFGRRFLDVDPAVLADDVLEQVASLDALARSVGGRVTYVKPHGALYHAIVQHEAQAAAVVAGVRAFGDDLAVLGLPGSRWLALAEAAGLRPVREAFADRAYSADGTLVPRGEPGPCSPTRPSWSTAACGWPRRGRSWRPTGRSCGSTPSRCACTATHQVPCRSPGPCGRR